MLVENAVTFLFYNLLHQKLLIPCNVKKALRLSGRQLVFPMRVRVQIYDKFFIIIE